jgi:hypothetical protein
MCALIDAEAGRILISKKKDRDTKTIHYVLKKPWEDPACNAWGAAAPTRFFVPL